MLSNNETLIRCCFCKKLYRRERMSVVPQDEAIRNEWCMVLGGAFQREIARHKNNYVCLSHLHPSMNGIRKSYPPTEIQELKEVPKNENEVANDHYHVVDDPVIPLDFPQRENVASTSAAYQETEFLEEKPDISDGATNKVVFQQSSEEPVMENFRSSGNGTPRVVTNPVSTSPKFSNCKNMAMCSYCMARKKKSEMTRVPDNQDAREKWCEILGHDFACEISRRKYSYICMSHFDSNFTEGGRRGKSSLPRPNETRTRGKPAVLDRRDLFRCSFCLRSRGRNEMVDVPSSLQARREWSNILGVNFTRRISKEVDSVICSSHFDVDEDGTMFSYPNSAKLTERELLEAKRKRHRSMTWRKALLIDCCYCTDREPRSKMIKLPESHIVRKIWSSILGEEFRRNIEGKIDLYICMKHFDTEDSEKSGKFNTPIPIEIGTSLNGLCVEQNHEEYFEDVKVNDMLNIVPRENSFNIVCVCSFCGRCRLDVDVVVVPQFLKFKWSLWSDSFGENFGERVRNIANTVICREHFENNMFEEDFSLKIDAVPKKVDKQLVKYVDTYFHDHCYMKLRNPNILNEMQNESSSILTICLICEQSLSTGYLMLKHAETHLSDFNPMDHICDIHAKEYHVHKKALSSVTGCEDCFSRLTEATRLQLFTKFRQCFPLFKCTVPEKKERVPEESSLEEVNNELLESGPTNTPEPKAARKPRKTNHKLEEEIESGNYVLMSRPDGSDGKEIKREVEDDEVKRELEDDYEDQNYQKPQTSRYQYIDYDEDEEDVPEKPDPDDEDFVLSGEEYEDDNSDSGRDEDGESKRERSKVTNKELADIIREQFDINRHPSVKKICEIAHESIKAFQTIFEIFRRLRDTSNTKCEDDCVCLRIETYINQNLETHQGDLDPNNVNIPDEELFELFSKAVENCNGMMRKHDFYLLAEETKIPPSALKVRFRKYKSTRVVNERIKEWEEQNKGLHVSNLSTMHVMFRQAGGKNNRLPREAVKQLEIEFKKDQNCSAEFFEQYNLTKYTIRQWYDRQKRKLALPRKDGKIEKRHTFTEKEKAYLNERFEENSHPTRERYFEMARELKLTFPNVTYWFMQRRTTERKKKELEAVKDSIENMSEDHEKRLKSILDERRKIKFDERLNLARELGLSYQTVTLWFEKKLEERKNEAAGQRRSGRKRRKRKLSSSEDDDYASEASLEYDEEAQWKSIEQLAKNAKNRSEDDDDDDDDEDDGEEDEEEEEAMDEQ